MTLPLRNLAAQIHSSDTLDVREFSVQQRISSLFEITLVALSDNADIDFDAVVGQPASFRMDNGAPAFWTGICKHVEQIAVEERGLSTYQITLVPTLWLATQRRNYRMFQQLSELDIARKLLAEWGIAPELRITGVYRKRKYRVQYAESDFAFLSRMLEDAGISFYFEASESGSETKLVLSDAPQANEPRSRALAFRDHPTPADKEHVTNVHVGQQVRPGRYTLQDHDARLPASYPLLATAEAPDAGLEGRLERFHYAPGAFLFGTDQGGSTSLADDKGKTRTDEKEGGAVARRRLEAKRGSAKVCSFETNAIDLAPGVVMSILDHPRSDLAADKQLLIVESTQHGTSDGAWSHRCEARRADVAYRPALATPKPRIHGVESATVVGSPGEEIHTDELGRVRVHFHWDRESRMNDNSSCWIHVSHSWAGAGYGGMNLPRVGQEVLVDFLGGDPDRPVITGRVYTSLQPVPYGLPANKTQSGWKSHSSPGGGGFNEIRFEDAKGREQVYIQAEKDLDKLVKHDETITIGHDQTEKVGHDRTEKVEHDESLTVDHDRTRLVKHDETITVDNDRTRVVGNDETITVAHDRLKVVLNDEDVMIGNNRSKRVSMNERETVGMNRTRVVGVNESVKVGKSQRVKVGGKRSVKVGKTATETVGLAKTVTVGGMYSTTVGGAMSTTVGLMHSELIGLTKSIVVGKQIEITCGKSRIVMESSGKITLEGTEIVIKGKDSVKAEGETITVKAEGNALLEGAKVQVVGEPIELN